MVELVPCARRRIGAAIVASAAALLAGCNHGAEDSGKTGGEVSAKTGGGVSDKTGGGVSGKTGGNGPKIVPHELKIAAPDVAPFLEAGCTKGRTERDLDCSKATFTKDVPCNDMQIVPGLGALEPHTPIVACYTGSFEQDALGKRGCMYPATLLYYVFIDGKVSVIRTRRAFLERFAPVESPDEALAFALALSDLRAEGSPRMPDKYIALAPTVEGTHVETAGTGFSIKSMFGHNFCGCGSHPDFAADVTVDRDGKVGTGDETPVWRDPKKEGLCVD